MSYQGEDRRKGQVCIMHKTFEERLDKLVEGQIDVKVNLASINEKMESLITRLNQDLEAKNKLQTTMWSIISAFVIQAIIVASVFGAIGRQVEVNTQRWNSLMAGSQIK